MTHYNVTIMKLACGFFWAAFASICVAQDSAALLARILAEKGTITQSELGQIESAASGDRITLLARLLEQKGVLTSADVASLGASSPKGNVVAQSPPPIPPPPTVVDARPVTAQSKFPVTIYGTIMMSAFYNTAPTNIFDIPLFTAKQGSDALGNDKNIGMTTRESRLGLRYNGGDVMGGRLGGQVEVDFMGGKAPYSNGIDMDILRLRIAEARLDWEHVSFEAGLDWSIFAPLNPTSLAQYGIPPLSASGNPWIRAPQLITEFRDKLAPSTSVVAQFAAMDPDMGDYNTSTLSIARTPGAGERGRAPGAEARFALTDRYDDRNFTLGLSGVYTHGKNSGPLGAQTVQLPFDAYGVALDYMLPFTKMFNLSGEAYIGSGLGFFSAPAGEGYLPPGNPGQRGVRSRGGWSQAQFNFTPKLQMNLAYGIDDPRARDLPVGNRTRNQTYTSNFIYKVSPAMSLAWEYRRMLTDFRNQKAANERGDVVNLSIGYMF